MADKFKKGEVVVVRSGGPPMTVEEVASKLTTYNGQPQGYYETVWFKGASKQIGRFEEHVLEKFIPPAKAGSATKP
jgi:uncharacterized protein YodC (DUF2158 family)